MIFSSVRLVTCRNFAYQTLTHNYNIFQESNSYTEFSEFTYIRHIVLQHNPCANSKHKLLLQGWFTFPCFYSISATAEPFKLFCHDNKQQWSFHCYDRVDDEGEREWVRRMRRNSLKNLQMEFNYRLKPSGKWSKNFLQRMIEASHWLLIAN